MGDGHELARQRGAGCVDDGGYVAAARGKQVIQSRACRRSACR
jgi:hypothetical protein